VCTLTEPVEEKGADFFLTKDVSGLGVFDRESTKRRRTGASTSLV
jgi:hypothetical protein